MDSRVAHSQVHENDEQNPHNVDSQQEEQHTDHEKKSSPIMNRMKAKAKKIKNTITKHGQLGNGNNNEHQHIPDDGDLDEDKEMVEDPEVYETPIYDSEVVKSATPASEKVENSGKSGSDDHMKDIRPIQESFERMNIRDELKPTTEPKIQSTVADTEYPPTGSHDQFVPHTSAATKTHNGRNLEIPSTKEETFNTTDETEISPATADGTENNEASKLGHDEKGDRNGDKVENNDEKQESKKNGSNMSGRTAGYRKNIANSLTEKLAPVYGKVAEVGSAVKSKVYGTSTGGVETETKNGVKDQGKGVPVKGYLAEKLRPGEEDKTLSEVISEALHKRKEEPVKKGDGDLSNGDDKTGEAREESHVNSPGKRVVNKVKDVVGSWFAKSGENQSPQGGEDLSKNKDPVAEGERVSQVVNE